MCRRPPSPFPTSSLRECHVPPSFLLLSLLVNACHPVHRRVALFNDTSLRGRAKLLCAALFCASHFDCVARVHGSVCLGLSSEVDCGGLKIPLVRTPHTTRRLCCSIRDREERAWVAQDPPKSQKRYATPTAERGMWLVGTDTRYMYHIYRSLRERCALRPCPRSRSASQPQRSK